MQPLFEAANFPYTLALSLMLFLSLYQIGSLLLGLALPGSLDIPDIPDFAQGGLGNILDWLNLGKVPVIVYLILFFWLFGALGFCLQAALSSFGGFYAPAWVGVPVVLSGALTLMHWIVPPLARVLPRDESTAIDEEYVGRTAVITIGTATVEKPAEGRVKDRFGRDRYLRVIPDLVGESFNSGDEVLIVARKGTIYSAIRKED
jgi:hypothetical protein